MANPVSHPSSARPNRPLGVICLSLERTTKSGRVQHPYWDRNGLRLSMETIRGVRNS